MYLVDPLKKLLPAIVDFDLVNSGKTRFTPGLTTVQTGQCGTSTTRKRKKSVSSTYSARVAATLLSRRVIDGEYYWDGGVYSNSPIEVVFDEDPRRSSVVSAIQIWHTRGPRPESLSHAFMHEKDILFGTRSKTHIMRQAQLHRMRRIIRELVDMLPEDQKRSPRVKELAGWSCTTTMHLVEINAQPIEGETNARDYDFSRPPGGTSPLAGGLRRRPAGCWSGGRGMIRSIQRPTLLSTNSTRRPEAPSSSWKNLGDTTVILLVADVSYDKNDHHM